MPVLLVEAGPRATALSATLLPTGPVPSAGSVSAVASVVMPGEGDLAVSVAPVAAPAPHGAALATATVRNLGPGTATGPVRFTTTAEGSGEGWSCAEGTCTSDAGPLAVGESLPPLALRSTPAPERGVVVVGGRIEVVDGNDGNDAGSAELPVVEGAGAALTAYPRFPGPVGSDGVVDVPVLVRNDGDAEATGPVVLEVSGGVEPRSASGPGWSCTALTCEHASSVAAGSALPPLVVRTATGDAGWPPSFAVWTRVGGRTSLATAGTGGRPVDLVPVLTTPAPALPGDAVVTDLRVVNRGELTSAGEVALVLTSGAVPWTAAGAGWACAGAVCRTSQAVPAGGASSPLRVVALARPDRSGATLPLEARVSGGGDPRGGRLQATVPTGAYPVVLVPVVTSDAPSPGSVRAATVRVVNAGWRPSPGRVQVQLTPGAGTRASGDGWTCSLDLACAHEGPVPARGGLPELRVEGGRDPSDDPSVSEVAAEVTAGSDWNAPSTRRASARQGHGRSAPSLALVLESPTAPYRERGSATTRLRVRDVGVTAHPGPVTVELLGGIDAALTGSGSGWQCRGDQPFRCTHPGGAGAGSTLPDLLVGTEPDLVRRAAETPLQARLAGPALPGQDDGLTTPFARQASQGAELTWPVAREQGAPPVVVLRGGPAEGLVDRSGVAALDVPVVNVSDAAVTGVSVELRAGDGARVQVQESDALWTCTPERCTATGPLAPGEVRGLRAALVVEDAAVAEVAVTRTVGWLSPVPGSATTVRPWRVAYQGVDLAPVVRPDGPSTGETAAFRVAVRNVGGQAATGRTRVLLTVAGSAGLVTASGEGWECGRGVPACTTTRTAPPGGELPELRVEVPTLETRTGPYPFMASTRVAAVVEHPRDTVLEDDAASSTVPGRSSASDLDLSTASGPSGAGPTAQALVAVTNTGNAPYAGPVRVDVTAPATTVVVADPAWACGRTLPEQWSCTSAGLAPGASRTLRFQHPLDAGTTLRASVQDELGGNGDPDTAVLEVPGTAGRSAVLAVRAPTPVAVGDGAAFTVDVRAVRSAPGPVRLTLRDELTTTYLDDAASGEGWSCSARVCTHPGPLVAGQLLPELSVVLGGRLRPAGTLRLSPSLQDGTAASAATSSSERSYDLTVQLSAEELQLDGGSSRSTVLVSNVGRGAAPGPVRVQLTADAFVTTQRASGAGWQCDDGTCTAAGPVAPGSALPPLAVVTDVRDGVILGGRLRPTAGILSPPGAPWEDEGRPGNGYSEAHVPTVPVDAGPARVVAVTPGGTGPRTPTVLRFSRLVVPPAARLERADGTPVAAQLVCGDGLRACTGAVAEARLVPVTPLADGASYRVVVPPGGLVAPYEGALFRYAASAGPFALTRYDGAGVPGPSPSPDRFSTARETALRTFPAGARTVVLARADAFADALAGSTLAGSLDAPVLLTATGVLPEETGRALGELGAQEVVVLGGTAAVSDAVLADLRGRGLAVRRLSGADRYETAAAVTREVDLRAHPVGEVDGLRTALLGSGELFPDVLAAAGPGFGRGLPVLVTRPDALPAATAALLRELGVEQVVVVGGTGSVSARVASQVQAVTGRPVERVSGPDRYATAAALAAFSWDRLGFDRTAVHVARGDAFADALAAGPASGRDGAPLVLVAPGALPPATAQLLVDRCGALRAGRVLGGSGAVPVAVVRAAEAAVRDCRLPR